jgi:hypothetical protein
VSGEADEFYNVDLSTVEFERDVTGETARRFARRCPMLNAPCQSAGLCHALGRCEEWEPLIEDDQPDLFDAI